MSGEKVDRRAMLKTIIGTVAGLIVGGVAGYYLRSPVVERITETVERTKTVTTTETVSSLTTQVVTTPTVITRPTIITTTATVPTTVTTKGPRRMAFLNAETDKDSILALKKAVEAYIKEVEPKLSIELSSIGWTDVWARLTMDIPAGRAPEVATFPWNGPAYTLAYRGFMEPVEDILESMNKIYGGSWDDWGNSLIRLGGHIYVVPFDTNGRTYLYRKDIFEEAGVSVPETWDELIEIAPQLQADTDGDGKIDRWAFAWPAGRTTASTTENIICLLWQCGSKVVDDDLNVVLDSPEYLDASIQALEYHKKLVDISPPGMEGADWPQVITLFRTGQVASAPYGGGRIIKQVWETDPEMEKNIRIAPSFPVVDPKNPIIYLPIDSWGVLSASPLPEDGKAFLEWLATTDWYITFLHSVPIHFTPPNRKIVESKKFWELVDTDPPDFKPLVELLNRHKDDVKAVLDTAYIGRDFVVEPGNTKPNPFTGDILGSLILPDMVQNYVLGRMSAKDAVKTAADQLRSLISKLKSS